MHATVFLMQSDDDAHAAASPRFTAYAPANRASGAITCAQHGELEQHALTRLRVASGRFARDQNHLLMVSYQPAPNADSVRPRGQRVVRPLRSDGNDWSNSAVLPAQTRHTVRRFGRFPNFYHEGVNDKNLWIIEGLTNIFVPFTKASDLPAHEIQAMPQIKQFASELDDLVRQILAREGGLEAP